MERLREALGVFLDPDDVTEELAQVLALACQIGTISYADVERVSGNSSEDVLLLGWEWRLLLPVRTSRCGEWDDRILVVGPGETYEMPNVARYLVEHALRTGEWNSDRAVAELFEVMGEPAWQRIPILVKRMCDKAAHRKINALEIGDACRGVGLGDRVDTLIATLKGSGVMSPRLAPLAEVTRTGTPIYELNPCVFAETRLVDGGGRRDRTGETRKD